MANLSLHSSIPVSSAVVVQQLYLALRPKQSRFACHILACKPVTWYRTDNLPFQYLSFSHRSKPLALSAVDAIAVPMDNDSCVYM